MILALFLVILAISILLTWFGEYTEEGVYSLGGLFLLFVLGLLIILPGTLTIPNGEVVSYNYSCGCCDGHDFIIEDVYTFSCFGTPNSCDTYDGNQISCVLVGCTWDDNSSLCFGNPYDCDNYIDMSSCTIAGCQYAYESGNGCPNGTIEVVTSETHSPINEPFNDGLSHSMGFWLCIIGVFGFAIKVSQIKAGFKQP